MGRGEGSRARTRTPAPTSTPAAVLARQLSPGTLTSGPGPHLASLGFARLAAEGRPERCPPGSGEGEASPTAALAPWGLG